MKKLPHGDWRTAHGEGVTPGGSGTEPAWRGAGGGELRREDRRENGEDSSSAPKSMAPS
jgi:hypothetical protein